MGAPGGPGQGNAGPGAVFSPLGGPHKSQLTFKEPNPGLGSMFSAAARLGLAPEDEQVQAKATAAAAVLQNVSDFEDMQVLLATHTSFFEALAAAATQAVQVGLPEGHEGRSGPMTQSISLSTC